MFLVDTFTSLMPLIGMVFKIGNQTHQTTKCRLLSQAQKHGRCYRKPHTPLHHCLHIDEHFPLVCSTVLLSFIFFS